ncbi:LacI family transcriptional regulator [Mumia sp. zg.B53]|uniref:LacI family DNA-binding transcriptional regulator n=1 Tax=unclassified Mumia TaxID=2621872 RepID=UPI001C6E4B24|nr:MULTISPECIES: LacI family DNA-binding transcriptional regulator [unclassified Mumia]MBW9207914.1 LacI family transcriptional regulator [Mumia sp. zg.B17]MBW9209740.1 LacI family transcriptional regulator [Mumia sp. zg.B21]MBW9214343.1 LacI family transcriptional regulator [Mumia sp. zg.B53]MDD9348388.1 LacI family DNA-binding transcriptional regulator [Mumia sp.]
MTGSRADGTTKRPTLEQVAALAGVGRGTASRVINGSPSVAPQTRDAVMKAVADLGYVPNQAARSLVTRRTGAIALVISEPEERLFSEPFFAGVVRGISSVMDERDRQLVLVLVHGAAERRDEPAAYLSPQHVDGALLLSQHEGDDLPQRLRERGLRLVFGGRPPSDDGQSWVDVDNVGGARAAVAHLLARRRTTVATIAGPPDMQAGRDRLLGYREALDAAGVPFDTDLVATGDFTELGGWRAMRQLLEHRPDLDAVFVASDPMALGALRALREAGRSIPDSVAVVGFDDSPMAAVSDPPLTTVNQPVELLGREAAEMLLARLADPEGASPRSVVLPTSLVVRGSS